MKIQISTLINIYLIFLIIGCNGIDSSQRNWVNVTNYDLAFVYEQKIPNSNKALYKFSLSGNITGSTFSGITVLDTINSLNKSNFGKRLPFSCLKKLPTKDSINVIKLVNPNDNYNVQIEPIKRESIIKGDIPYKIEYREKYNGYGTPNCFLDHYSFVEIQESKDSIHIFGLKSKFVDDHQNVKQLSFKKGNIELIEQTTNKLNRIIVEELIDGIGDERIFNKESPKYGNEQKSINIVCMKTYFFDPVNEILINSFSDYGFYKKKNLNPTTTEQ